jgi:hypothetical protein
MQRNSVIRRTERTRRAVNRLAACSVLVVWTSCISLTAQNVVLTGALGGRVIDESGGVVSGASIVVRNLATGLERSATTRGRE